MFVRQAQVDARGIGYADRVVSGCAHHVVPVEAIHPSWFVFMRNSTVGTWVLGVPCKLCWCHQ
jgi:hypothetical protein